MNTKARLLGILHPGARRTRPRAFGDPCNCQSLYDRAQLAIAELTLEGRITHANAALQQLLGYSEDELRAVSLEQLAAPEDRLTCRARLDELVNHKAETFEEDQRWVRKDGEVRSVRLRVVAVTVGGQLARLLALGADVTEQKRGVAALRASEEKYRSLYVRTPAMLHSIDPDGRILSVSDKWLSTMGYERDEVLGRRSVEFLTPDSRRFAEEVVLPAFFKAGRCEDVPCQFVKQNGELIDILLSATAERDSDGRVTRSLAVLVDVSARNRAEEIVRRLAADLESRVRERTAELELRTAILTAEQETCLDAILIVDPRRKILSYNRRLAEVWGIPAKVLELGSDEEALRLAWPKLRYPEAFLARVEHLYAHPNEQSFDEIELLDGRTLERYSSPILGPEKRYYGRVWYFRDVTSSKRTRRAMLEQNEELERSNADLEIYANATSHDLAAPLGKIIGFGQLLQRSAGAKLDGRELDLLGRMIRTGEDMGRLIRDILLLSRVGREELPLETVSLDLLMADVLSDYEVAIADAGGKVAVGPLPTLRAHESNLRRLLQNLLSNAIKFRAEGRAARIAIGSRNAADGGVEIFVEDNGIGFDPKMAERIFEPFVRLNPPGEHDGTGIGLAVCRRIAARYHGRLTATSAPSRGSTFTLWLPPETRAV